MSTAPPVAARARPFAVWWSLAAPGHGTTIAGSPTAASSAVTVAPARVEREVGSGVRDVHRAVEPDHLIQDASGAIERMPAAIVVRVPDEMTYRKIVAVAVRGDECVDQLVQTARAEGAAHDEKQEAVERYAQLGPRRGAIVRAVDTGNRRGDRRAGDYGTRKPACREGHRRGRGDPGGQARRQPRHRVVGDRHDGYTRELRRDHRRHARVTPQPTPARAGAARAGAAPRGRWPRRAGPSM